MKFTAPSIWTPTRVIFAVIVGIALAFAYVGTVCATQPDEDGEHKVGICHRTASDSNPYVYIEVDVASLSPGHLDNADPGHKPTFWKSDGVFRGVAHVDGDPKDDYLADSAEDCDDFVVEPTPTPTPEPTEPPCYAEGWAPGDQWGPGENDVISEDAVPCPTDPPVVTPQPSLPPTDTEDAGMSIPTGFALGLFLLIVLSSAIVIGAAMSNGNRR